MKQEEVFSPENYVEKVMNSLGQEVGLENVKITKEVDITRPGTGQIRYELYEGEEVVYATYLTVIVTE